MSDTSGWRWVVAPLVPVAIAGVILVASRALLVGCDEDPERLGEAELFASGGDALSRELNDGDATLDDVQLERATRVDAGEDGDLYVLVEGGGDELVEASGRGEVKRARPAILDILFREDTAIGVGPDGTIVKARDDNQGLRLTFQDFVHGPTETSLAIRFVAGAVSLREDGSVLVGGRNESRIDVVGADGTTTGLLGPPGSDARVISEPLGRIVALVGLPDDRVVFVADTADGFEMYVLDDTEVRPVVPNDPSPVRSDGARPIDPSVRADRLAMTPIAPAPGGRVLATGIGRRGDPEISVVDVDSGEVEVLVVLEDVEPTIDEPVSAAAVGEDLVFLAEGKLWKLEDAFPTG